MDKSSKSLRERKKGKAKEEIMGIALGLFQQNGFEATTMEEIAEEANVAKRTLYNYFSSKQSIISEYMKSTVKSQGWRLEEIITEEKNTYSRLMGFLLELAKWNEENKMVLQMHTSYRLNSLLSNQEEDSHFEQVLAKIIKLGQEEGDLRIDIPHTRLAQYLKSMYMVPFRGWLVKGEKNHDQVLKEMVDLFLSGAKGC